MAQMKPPLLTKTSEDDSNVVDIGTGAASTKGGNLSTQLAVLSRKLQRHLEEKGERVAYGDGGWHMYKDGVWRVASNVDFEDLCRDIADIAETCGLVYATKENAILTYLRTSYDFRIDPRQFNELPLVAVEQGTLNLMDLTISDHSPENYITRSIDTVYNPEAPCPGWLAMLDRVFEDRDPEQRAAIISFLQEWFGVALMGGALERTPRALRKALFLYGPHGTGKSTILAVLRRLLGSVEYVTARVRDINDKHGLESFIGAAAWISEEADGMRFPLDAGRLKSLITGEPQTAKRKYMKDANFSFHGPVVWSSNAQPNFSESSGAIYDRVVVLHLERQFTPEEATLHFGGLRPEDWLEQEGEYPGILNWAVEGYIRLLERGRYDELIDATRAAEDWREQNDAVYAFVKDCCEPQEGVSNSGNVLAWAAHAYIRATRNEWPKLKTLKSDLRNVVPDVYPTIRASRSVVGGSRVQAFPGLALNELGQAYLRKLREDNDAARSETGLVNAAVLKTSLSDEPVARRDESIEERVSH